jgi:cobalt-zinc-cadmium efflux system outer membrane protein
LLSLCDEVSRLVSGLINSLAPHHAQLDHRRHAAKPVSRAAGGGVLSVHPEIQSARWGVEKAKFVLQRAKAEPIPNLGIDTGYVRQNQNRSNDFRIGVSASIPLWNKNQGNIRATEAELCAAVQEVGRVENDLTDRVATALREFAAARNRAERYQAVVGEAEQAQNIASEDQRRNLSPLMVLELQRSPRQARLERLKSLVDA